MRTRTHVWMQMHMFTCMRTGSNKNTMNGEQHSTFYTIYKLYKFFLLNSPLGSNFPFLFLQNCIHMSLSPPIPPMRHFLCVSSHHEIWSKAKCPKLSLSHLFSTGPFVVRSMTPNLIKSCFANRNLALAQSEVGSLLTYFCF